MKTRILIFTALATALMAGCSKESGENPNPPEDMTGKAFLSLSLTSNTPAQVRAATNEEKPGSEDESAVTAVTVLLFDEMNNCLKTVTASGLTIGNGGTTATASDVLEVPAATKKIFAVINPYVDWNISSAAGKTWTEINALLDNAVITNVASAKSFMMASAGDLAKGALTGVTPEKPDNNTQQAIDAAKAKAQTNAVELKIDRLAAKVTLSLNETGVTVPTGANFAFQGWDLNITNKSVRLYTDLVSYANATAGAAKGVYRKDNNYTVAEQPAGADAMKAAFNYLTNGAAADASGMSAVDKAAGADLYCLENTMAADAQKLGYTTKAVVKAKYAPAGFSLGDSYFFWNGAFFTLDGIKAAYLEHADGTGLKVDLPEFLHKAGKIMSDAVFGGTQDEKNTAVAALKADDFNATSGIVGRYCAVRYYHQSVCYYDVLIRHDQNVTDKMALGKYGVVRNNWYGLQINSVSNPGTPWIPDPTDPEDPTKPDTPDDEDDFYLSVKITVNPWTYWSQGVDLN